MDRYEAQEIVRKTLQNPFDKDRFYYFVKNLLNRFDEAAFIYRGNYIPDAYKQYIDTLERVGKYQDPEGNKIDILIVRLKKESSLEYARTMQRNFVAWYLNGSRGGELKDAALVAFVSPSSDDWRFSLVKMEYKLAETLSGKIKAEEEFTPARRFSFLVGLNENSHTAQSRLVPIIKNDINNPTLKQFEEAFNIEKVTKEFFEKYRELFLWTKETLEETLKKDSKIKVDFTTKQVNTIDFAKKLLGQIVFLYFLQKKGWFGVERDNDWGTGAKDFLRRLFEKMVINYNNYFNDILEPLFYEALAKERDDNFYSRFNCKIPFLNGGLFDPIGNYDWVHTDICLPNELFSNNFKTKEGDVGTGILDVFDRYNFTVKEDEPLEKEVAVDPEMLGKVFENLLEVKDRKSKGTYYTPREIVHYMCQGSLINYLVSECEGKVSREDIEKLIKFGEAAIEHDSRVGQYGRETQTYSYKLPESIRKNAELIDGKLATIRVCDPAIGSGAFPVGMMNEIIRTRNALTNYINDKTKRTIYDFKRHAIQNCLYGVDIDLGAVEIAKLRLWLSLIVDEEDINYIKPLPNLDYKIMQGNSLVELLSPSLLTKTDDSIRNSLIDKFNELKNDFFSLTSGKDKQEKRNEINQQIRNIINYDIEQKRKILLKNLHDWQNQEKLFAMPNENLSLSDVSDPQAKKEIEKLTKQLKEIEQTEKISPTQHFEWHLNFNEVFESGGFNLIIANPPYIGEKNHKLIFREVRQGPLGEYYRSKMDYFYFFFHLAINLGTQKAQIVFITTNYYLTATSANILRRDFKNRTIIRNLINFNELKIFENARGQHNIITILTKDSGNNTSSYNCLTKRSGLATPEILHKILKWQDDLTDYSLIQQDDLYEGGEDYIRIFGISGEAGKNLMQDILNKISRNDSLLGIICNVNKGIVTGCDKVTPKHIRQYKLNDQYKKGDGIFTLSREELELLHLNDVELLRIKPWFKNSDISKYYSKIIATHFMIDICYPADKNIDLNSIPNLIKHLLLYKQILENRKTTANGLDKVLKKGYWWTLESKRKINFEGPKIICPQRNKTNIFSYNEIPWYASADVYYITQKDNSISLKYVLAILNSKLYYLWLYHKGKRKGETLELYQKPLSEIPVKKISPDEQKPFIEIVDKILTITGSNDYLSSPEEQAKVKDFEKQIDQLVFKLYSLTPEEMEIVEESKK